MHTGVFDIPVTDPLDDRMEIAPYAQALANFLLSVRPPFTIGIYGEWGAGKTSLVYLVKHFLTRHVRQPDRTLAPVRTADGKTVQFVEFSAWPYKTSDELWRALLVEIARTLYDMPKADEAAAAPPPVALVATGRAARLPGFLARDAVVFRSEPPPAEPHARARYERETEYQKLLARLDRTMYGGISKGAAEQARVDQEEMAAAVVKAAVSAMGAMSPLLAGLRGLLGLDGKVDAATLVQRDKNQATRGRIESMDEFRAVFKDLFAQRARDKRVCVFIDDLDRCMPDVALDLLEAVKIFLRDVECLFIVAADQELIGQGLRMRFGESSVEDDAERLHAFFEAKGRQYFEKIIQLGIPLPTPRAEQTRKFIASEFPQWLPATDIIQTAIGDNPRRLKQYCNWLRYEYDVATLRQHRHEHPAPGP